VWHRGWCVQVCWWRASGVPVQGFVFFGVSSEDNCGGGGDVMIIQQVCIVWAASVQYSVLVPGASCTVGKLGHWESQPSRPQILASTAESASYSRVVRVVASDCGTLVVLHHCCHPPLLGPLVRAQASLSFSNPIPLSLTSTS
jgi:hypothetical protein